MNLVIVESPAKCAKIKSFLGDGWRVVATMGHIRALAEDLDAIGLDRDFEPRFEFLKTKSKAITGLKDAMKGCSQVYLAADDDREGEAIAFSVCKLLKLDPTATPRAVFHEITKPAVTHAVANPRRINMPKVFAQQTRAMLDMMIGFTMSPLLWGIKRGLSAGRCQTPALRLVVEKEKEIEGFVSGMSWQVEGNWMTESPADAGGLVISAKMCDVLEDEESVQNYLEIRQEALGATVRSAVVKPWQLGAPEPFITSTLQQQASASLRMNPKRTMQIAQKLYEDGHITYMRTDSTALSDEAREEAQTWIREHLGAEYLGALAAAAPKPKKGVKKGAEPQAAHGESAKQTKPGMPEPQAAHECIRPTHFDLEDIESSEPGEKSLYRLIRNRTLQSLMARCEGETRRVLFDCDEDDGQWPWETSWKRTTFEGWRRLGRVAILDENEIDTDEENSDAAIWNTSAKLVAGSRLKWIKLEGRAVMSRAATRYTEATLVRQLEKCGIGRPSTFASLIAAIVDKGYVEVKNIEAKKIVVNQYELTEEEGLTLEEKQVAVGGEKQKMVPTPLGRSVIDFLMREYSDIFDYGFTARMESGLDGIASGVGNWKGLLRETWGSYKDRYYKHKIMTPVAANGQEGGAPGSAKIRHFPPYKAVMSGKGPLLLKEGATKADKTIFYGWPEGFEFSEITEEAAVAFCEKRATEIASKPATPTVGILKQIGSYVFREGKDGLSRYMYKDGMKDRKFVSIPEGLDLDKISEKEAANVYKIGLAQKGVSSGGRGRGRGGTRGK